MVMKFYEKKSGEDNIESRGHLKDIVKARRDGEGEYYKCGGRKKNK